MIYPLFEELAVYYSDMNFQDKQKRELNSFYITLSKCINVNRLAFFPHYFLNKSMADFKILANPVTEETVILAPRRANRPTITGTKLAIICPLCIGREGDEKELYRVGGENGDANWQIRVIPNKYPFAPHHELIIHSPDHHKNIDELPFSQVELLLQTYRLRFQTHAKQGQVYIFHNRGSEGGESLPHPHTQLTVIPDSVALDITPLDMQIYKRGKLKEKKGFPLLRTSLFPKSNERAMQSDLLETDHFLVFCPETSEWPDESWIAPKKAGKTFGESTNDEIADLAFVLSRLVQLFDLRHGYEFPFNFYIYPGKNWYLRLIPRLKTLGGFELGTKVMINTQESSATFAFILEHFWKPDAAKIRSEQQAEYWRSA